MIDPLYISLNISRLIADSIAGKLDVAEKMELDEWLNQNSDNRELYERIIKEKNIQNNLFLLNKYNVIEGRIKFEKKLHNRNRIRSIYRFTRNAAAILLPIICISVIYFFVKQPNTPTIIARNSIVSGSPKALLTLADGSTIVLDNVQNGAIATQGNTAVLKQNNKVIYDVAHTSLMNSAVKNKKVFYNTLTTPRGGEYQLTLADGTKVWLNAASSITFPTTFSGKERKVVITGEAYFEVTSLPLLKISERSKKDLSNVLKLPFIVTIKDKGVVRVLGTHFNINAYDDELDVKTTLLEGLVQFTSNYKRSSHFDSGASVLLKPGQQALLDLNGKVEVVSANTDEVIAWKKGNFLFVNQDLSTIMHTMERWYGINVIYDDNEVQHLKFVVDIRKYENFNKVKEILELTEKLSFTVEGKTVHIKKKTI